MKKFLAILLSIQLFNPYALAAYDFSDEAQAEFDRQKELQLQPVDFSKMRGKKEIKTPVDESFDRTNYTPSQELLVIPEFQQPQEKPLFGSVVEVPAGISFSVTFDSGISSGSLEKNDRLTVRLTNDLIYNGQTIAPAGSLVYGTTTNAKNAGRAYGSGALEINFNEILTPDGNIIKISTENVYMEAKSERAVKMTRDIVLGALGSMLIGAAFTAMGGGHDWGRNMAIYGGLGAIGGGLRGYSQTGEDIQIEDGTTIQVKLIENLKVAPYSL